MQFAFILCLCGGYHMRPAPHPNTNESNETTRHNQFVVAR